MKKNLILGTGTGYQFDDIKPFLNSLKQIDFEGSVTLLVSDLIDDKTKIELLQKGVELVYVDHRFLSFSRKYANSRLWKIHYLPHKLMLGLLGKGEKRLKWLSRYVKFFHLISGSRYCFYYDYLLKNKDEYDKVLLTDIRDVVFQADPFAGITGSTVLNFYCEENTIADSFYTAYWVKHAFGKKALEQIKSEISICSGTTIGTIKEILNYLEQMIVAQASITPRLTGLGGFDQGVHNYLIYNKNFPEATITPNIEGEVATLGNATNIILNDEHQLVNKRHELIPVVHQYDRLPDLKLKVLGN